MTSARDARPLVDAARRSRNRRIGYGVVSGASVLAVLVTWWVLTTGTGIIEPLKFPSPESAIGAVGDLRENLLANTAATAARVLGGLILGSIVGIGIGLLMSSNRWIRAAIEPLVEIVRPIPPIAIAPFFILWFGLAETGKIFLVVLGVAVIMTVQTFEAVMSMPRVWAAAAGTLGANSWQLYRTVIIPGIMPSIFAGIRISAGASFALVIAAEFLGAQTGLGFLILNARRTLNTDVILVCVILIGLLAFLLDQLIRGVARWLTRWKE